MLPRIFVILFPIFIIILLGYIYARLRPGLDLASANKLNMELFTPALLFYVLTDKNFDLIIYWQLAAAGMLIIIGSGLLIWPLLSYLRVAARTFIPPMMFTNTGNMGLPLALFAFGDNGLQAAVVLFIASNLLHLTLGIAILNPHMRWHNLITNPMIIASISGIMFNLFAWPVAEILVIPLKMLGDIAIPLMLFALGVRLIDLNLADWQIGLWGAILCPLSGLSVFLILWPWLQLDALQAGVLLCFALLPPAVINYMFAEQYAQEPQKVASIVLLGNVVSIISLPLALTLAFNL
jgi:malate permease and related proteins